MKCFSIFDIMKNLSSFNFTFSDNSVVTFTVNDLMNYLKWKSKNIPYYDDNELKIHDDISSFNLLWDAFNNNNKDSFTRIKDALGLTYNVLENYNGVTETEETETYDTADALSFANRLDTTTLSHSDTTTHNTTDTETHNTTDTETRNTQTRDSSDTTSPKTTTRAINEHKTVSHYTTGFNGESAVLEYEDVTLADAKGKGGSLNDEVITETGATLSVDTGTITDAKTGTITDAKTGTETTAHSGTITDGKTGTETTSKTGTVTREYTENKHGNLGVTTPVQMIGGECELRLKYKLRPMIIKSFIDEYFYL